MTDEYTAYKDLKFEYSHNTVNHGAKKYVNQMAHIKGIESFWSHLKCGIEGIIIGYVQSIYKAMLMNFP